MKKKFQSSGGDDRDDVVEGGISLWLTALLIVHMIGIHFFTSGFLLTRVQLDSKSQCTVLPASLQQTVNGSKTTDDKNCWIPLASSAQMKHKRVILFIIDAFRFDFVFKQDSMPFLNGLLSKRRESQREQSNAYPLLFKFVADAPTTTSQRLKALTTGSLPTFIDAGKNFDSDAVQEDNWVYQMAKNKRKVVALGDDTWKHLFPTVDASSPLFTRERLFPSFDVWDLHTLDDSILRYLGAELNTTMSDDELQQLYQSYESIDRGAHDFNETDFGKWDVLIAHFLGVDHAGHRYGVHHQEMHNKLKHMDSLLQNIIENLPEDTLLMMFGDHGMDENGDHGGGTDQEVNSALFVYSKHASQKAVDNTIKVFDSSTNEQLKYVEEHDISFRTISQIDLVPTLSFLLDVPIPFGNLGTIIPEVFQSICGERNSMTFNLDLIRTNSHQVWSYLTEYATTDSSLLSLDQISQLRSQQESADQTFSQITEQSSPLEVFNAFNKYHDFLLEASRICRERWASFDMMNMALGIGLSSCSTIAIILLAIGVNAKPAQFYVYFFIFESMIYFAIKFVIQPNNLVSWIGTSGVFLLNNIDMIKSFTTFSYLTLHFWSMSKNQDNSRETEHRYNLVQSVQIYLSIIMVVALLGSIFSNSYIVYEDRIILYCLLTQAILFFIGERSKYKHLPYHIMYMLAMRYSYQKLRLRIHGTHQILSAVPQPFSISSTVVISIGIIGCVGFSARKMSTTIRKLLVMYYVVLLGIISSYWYLNYYDIRTEGVNLHLLLPRTVYLLSFISICIGLVMDAKYDTDILFLVASIPFILLKGHSYLVIWLALFIQISCFSVITEQSLRGRSLGSTWLRIFHLAFFSLQYFFALGQQNSLNTIQWTSAFVGIDNAQLFFSGFLVILNTFNTKILFTLSLASLIRKARNVFALFSALFCAIGTFTMFCAFIQRRHLMVWAVFAPKFIFDNISTVVMSVITIAVLLIKNKTKKKIE